MNTSLLLTTLALNIVALIVAGYSFVRWFRKWVVRQITEPQREFKSEMSSSLTVSADIFETFESRFDNHMRAVTGRLDGLALRLHPLEEMHRLVTNLDEQQIIIDKRITQSNDIAIYALTTSRDNANRIERLEEGNENG